MKNRLRVRKSFMNRVGTRRSRTLRLVRWGKLMLMRPVPLKLRVGRGKFVILRAVSCRFLTLLPSILFLNFICFLSGIWRSLKSLTANNGHRGLSLILRVGLRRILLMREPLLRRTPRVGVTVSRSLRRVVFGNRGLGRIFGGKVQIMFLMFGSLLLRKWTLFGNTVRPFRVNGMRRLSRARCFMLTRTCFRFGTILTWVLIKNGQNRIRLVFQRLLLRWTVFPTVVFIAGRAG